MENQRLRQLLERSEQRERSMREVVSTQAQTPSGPPLIPNAAHAPVEAPLPAPSLAHQVHDATFQVLDALRAPASASGFWSNLWSGLQGSQRLPSNATPPGRAGHVREPMAQSAQVAQVPGTHRASSGPDPTFQPETLGLGQMRAEGANSGASPHSRPKNMGLSQIPANRQVSGGFASTAGQTPPGRVGQVPDTQGSQVSAAAAAQVPNSVVDALVLGVQQLQSLQAQQLKVKGDDAPEAVKPGITTLPKLVAPSPSGGSLEFQDWLELVSGLMTDLSDSSQLWWTSVLQLARDAFACWSTSSPVERLRVAPDDRTEIVEGKWSRVNARACAMLLESLDASVKADIIARRATQNAAHIMYRLHTIYQPGGTSERDLILRNLHDPPPFEDVAAGVSLLRSWGRCHRRCLECGMVAPDPSILARGLTTVTAQHIAENADVQFRTQCVRSALHIDLHPSGDEVLDYHKHLLAEFETMAGGIDARKVDPNPKVQVLNAAADASGGGNRPSGKGAGGGGAKPCRFFLTVKGCRSGPKCKFAHNMSELPKTERDKKCLACGSEEHRARDCKAGKATQDSTAQPSTPTLQAADPIRESDSAAVSSTSPASQPIVPATPVNASMVEFVQEALRAIRQVEANERAEVSVKASGGDAARNPSMQSLTIHCPTCNPTNSPNSQPEGVNVFGLVDSGATHPLRPASSQEEWLEAEQVEVGLAGGHASHMRITKHGVILTPPGRDGLPAAIVPLGQLVTRLGYMLGWTADECFLRSPEGELTTLRVQNGCPVIEHDRALTLIAELEAQRKNARSTFANRTANEVSSTLVIAKALQAFGLPLGGQDEHVSPSLNPGWGHGISAQMTAPIWPGQTPLLEPKKGVCGTQILDPKVCLQQSSTIWFRLDADDECDDNPTRYQLDGDGDSSIYDLDWTRLPLSPLGRDGPAQVSGPLPCCPGRFSLDGFGGFCMFGLREVQPTNCQDLATRPGGEHETTVPSSVAVPATSPREGGTRIARQRLTANLLFQLLLLCLLLLGVRGAVFAPCPGVRNPPAAASGTPVPYWVEEEQCVRLWGLSGVVPEPPVQEESQQPLAERVLLTTVRLAAAADGLVTAVCCVMPGFYLFRKRDHPVCAVFMLSVFLQVVGAASQQDEEPEDMLLPVPLDADLMLAVCIFGIAFCAIGLWEFLKWGFAFLSRRAFGTSSVPLSPRKARKLQRLRDRTEQAIRAEISEREAAASSSQRLATASGRNALASTRQADEAPTRFFATPEGEKLHRTKDCPAIARSSNLCTFEVCQRCHRRAPDHTTRSTG